MKRNMLFQGFKNKFFVFGLSLLLLAPMTVMEAQATEKKTEKSDKTVPSITVTGVIKEAHSGAGLPGARIQVLGDARYSAMTDSVGKYTIKLPTYVSSLWVSCDGHNSLLLPLQGNTSDIDAVLYSSDFSNDYEENISAKSKVAAYIDNRTADLSVDDQISSSLGGRIRSIMRSGTPGAGVYMMLNGINSLNANVQPLIVLDGIIMDMQYNREAIHDGFYNNLLANVSVEDIESVTVLRNGTAIYGAKGANGVVLINTKRNKSMATKVDVSIAGKYEAMPKLPDMMDASQYRTYVSELLGSTGTKLTDFKFLRDEKDYYYYRVYHNDTDWSSEVYDEAFTQNYSINVQGGDDIANYNLSVGYAAADAAIKGNSFSRFNLRLNSDIFLTKKFDIRFSASYSDVNRELRDDGVMDNITDNTITAPGFLSLVKAPFLNPYAFDTQGNISSFLAEADDYLDEVLGEEASLSNPLSILKNGKGDNKNSFGNRLISLSVTPTYNFGKGLALSEHFSFVMFNTDENYYLPVTGVPSFEIEEIGTVNNTVAAMSSHLYQTTSDTRLQWKKQWGASALDLMGGFRYNLSSYALNSLRGYNSGNDKSPNMSTGLSYKTTDGTKEKVTTLTYYLNGDYNYAGKYFLSAGLGMEASSRFGKDVDAGLDLCGVVWGLFPSVSASWIVSNESWFKTGDWFNYLKLNAGFDVSGNDDLDLSSSRTYFVSSNILQSIDGVVVGNIGNTALQWEETKRLTWGADMSFFNNRLSLSGHFFKSWTSELLGLQKLAYVSGLDTNWSNGGKLENKGIDIAMTGKVLNTKNWKWEIGVSVGHYDNKITELPGTYDNMMTSVYGATILTQVGSPIGLFYGYETNGVYANTEAAKSDGYYQLTETGAKQYFEAGDMRFVNHEASDNEINEKDRVVIGDPNPDIYGNIFTNLHYKNWDLGVVFNYSLGNDVYNYQRSILEGGSYFYNQTTAMLGRWTTEGQEASIPKISYEDKMGNSRFSDRWIEDGSYLRLKSLTLSYTWDIQTRYLHGLTVWGAANNLFTLTKYLGSDPEFSSSNNVLYQGIDRGLLPTNRSFSVGLKINL